METLRISPRCHHKANHGENSDENSDAQKIGEENPEFTSGKNPPEKNSNEEAQVLIATFGSREKSRGKSFPDGVRGEESDGEDRGVHGPLQQAIQL